MNRMTTTTVYKPDNMRTTFGTDDLLPFVQIEQEEIEILEKMMPTRVESWKLDVSIGKGITLTAHMELDDHHRLNVDINAADRFLAFPLTLTASLVKFPEMPEEHHDYCPYAMPEECMERDEYGSLFFIDDMGEPYYEEDWDCHCDPETILDSVIVVHDNDQLTEASGTLAMMVDGFV